MRLHLTVFICLLSLLVTPVITHAEMSSAKYSISEDSISGIEITDNLDNGQLQKANGSSELSSDTDGFNIFDYRFQILILSIIFAVIIFMLLRFKKRHT